MKMAKPSTTTLHAPRPGARVQIVEFGNYFGRKKYVGARRL